MSDLITAVILGIFGVVTVLVVLAFILVRQSSKPRFEKQDYYKSYKGNSSYSRGGNPFKQMPSTQDQKEQRMVVTAIIAVAVISLLVAVFFDVFEGLLIIFLLPIVIRFIRMRNEANGSKNKARDESRSSY